MTADGLRQWFSDAWRTGVATGEFVAALTAAGASMAAGNAAGAAAVALGAGAALTTVASGLAIALTFVVVYSVIPEEIKRQITSGIQATRGWMDSAAIGRTGVELRQAFLRRPLDDGQAVARKRFVAALLRERDAARDALITIAFERAYLALKGWRSGSHGATEKASATALIAGAASSALAAIDVDVAELDGLVGYAGRARAGELAPYLAADAQNARRLREFVAGMLDLSSSILQLDQAALCDPDSQQVLSEIELAYKRGFSSRELIGYFQASE
jgi:hypothetical protein